MSHNIHDHFFKGVFSVRENLQDLIQGTLPRDILSGLDLNSLEYDPTEYVDDELSGYFKDISCSVKYSEQKLKISLLYEHKSYPDQYIQLQLLQYMLNIWDYQAENNLELSPVICVVIYHGKPRWKVSGILEHISEELRPYVPMFDFILFDINQYKDRDILQHFKTARVNIGIWALKWNRDLVNFIHEHPELARKIFNEIRGLEKPFIHRFVVYLYNVTGMETEKINQIMETVAPDLSGLYNERNLKKFQEKLEEGFKKGLEHGLEQSKFGFAENMISKGYSDDQIMEITGLSKSQVRKFRKDLQS